MVYVIWGDLDIDQDMVVNVEDADIFNREICADRDMDGLCNVGDADDDNDGVLDLNELPEGLVVIHLCLM